MLAQSLSDRNSVRVSVRLSVRLSFRTSVTCVLCDEMKERTADISTPHERAITL